jgi:hypothetical protein
VIKEHRFNLIDSAPVDRALQEALNDSPWLIPPFVTAATATAATLS